MEKETRMLADKLIVAVSIGAACFAGGIEVGQEQQKAALATHCEPQRGEKLSVVVQHPDRVECIYASFPARQIRIRSAS